MCKMCGCELTVSGILEWRILTEETKANSNNQNKSKTKNKQVKIPRQTIGEKTYKNPVLDRK